MRKTSAVLASLSLAVLTLTGCTAASTFDGEACDRAAGATSSLADSVSAKGEIGSKPDVTVFSPLHTKKTQYADLVTGDGPQLVSDSQGLVAEISIFSGDTGKQIFGSAYDEAKSPVKSIGYWATQSQGLEKVLKCATEGSRVVAALTPEDFGVANLEGLGLEDDDTAVFVIDIVDVLLPKAEGALQFNDANGLPTVVRAPDGTPGVIIPDTDAPKKAVTQTLIKGDGPAVKKDDTVVTHVMAVGWDEKDVLSSTWGSEPRVGPAAAELVGATVGSQLLIVMPASDGSAPAAIVVDILGVTSAPAQ